MLISTLPKNDREKAVIARSKQLTDFRWTPIRDVPTYIRNIGNTVLAAGEEVVGFPYASEELNDKFICENVSFETFLTAIKNPHSKLYQPGQAAFYAVNYGIVCNGLARYALGITERVSTARWHTIPGMREIKPRGAYTVNEIELCDLLYTFCEERKHVSLITDILRNESGEIKEIEVSEAVRPSCRRARYSPEVFYEKYKLFALWRYDLIDEVPLLDDEVDKILKGFDGSCSAPKIAVDNGDKSNYLESEQVIISVFKDEADTVEILCDGELIEAIPVAGKSFFPRELARGYYTIRLRNTADSTCFCVNRASLRHEVNGNDITVYADSCDERSEIVYMDFRQSAKAPDLCFASLEKYEKLTEEEKATGCITRPIPKNGPNYKVYFKNEYGIWTHHMTSIF